MRLLLDEHYTAAIAAELRSREHDVWGVQERGDLAGLDDEALLEAAVAEERALVTENVADFVPILRSWEAAGRAHLGVVFTSRRRLPRSRGTIGLFVRTLDAFLRERPSEDALRDQVVWLPE